MIQINLLPVKSLKKIEKIKKEIWVVIAILSLISFVCLVVSISVMNQVFDLNESISFVQNDIDVVSKQIEKVEELKKKSEGLSQKLQVIDVLKKQKQGPAHVLDDLSAVIEQEPKVWLIHFEEKEGVLKLEGGSVDSESISRFQIQLSRSKFFQDIHLQRVESSNIANNRFFNFTMQCRVDYSAGI